MQSRYRSGVGMLLNLINHPRPDIANVVRVIAKGYGQRSDYYVGILGNNEGDKVYIGY